MLTQFKSSFMTSDEKSNPVESSYGYDVEYRNVFFSFYNDQNRGHYTDKLLYDYFIKDNKALMITVDVTMVVFGHYTKETKQFSSVLQSQFRTGNEQESKQQETSTLPSL